MVILCFLSFADAQKIKFESSSFQRLNCKPKIYRDLAADMTDDATYATVFFIRSRTLAEGVGWVEVVLGQNVDSLSPIN